MNKNISNLFILQSILLLTVTTSSCDNDSSFPKNIKGHWTWEKSVGGWGTLTPENTEEKRSLKIGDYLFKSFINDSLVFESPYDIEIREDPYFDSNTFIIFDSRRRENILLSKCELIWVEDGDDGFTHYYYKN
jgi:hypothetical protein